MYAWNDEFQLGAYVIQCSLYARHVSEKYDSHWVYVMFIYYICTYYVGIPSVFNTDMQVQ